MRAKFINEYERGVSPKSSMGIGYDQKLEDFSNRDWKNPVKPKEIDDEFILYLCKGPLKGVYEKWKKNRKTISPEQVEVWKDRTSGGTGIIKMKAPGIRESTVLRWENNSEWFKEEVFGLMSSESKREEIANSLTKWESGSSSLAGKVGAALEKANIRFSWEVDEHIAERMIKLLG